MAVIDLSRAREARRGAGERTWNDAVRRWRWEMRHRATGTIRREEQFLAWLSPCLSGLPLGSVTRGRLADIRSAGLESGWSNRTANYCIGTVTTIMRAAVEWEWATTFPKLRALQTPPHRTRWLTREEAGRLLDELPPHLEDMARFTLLTGLRKGTLRAMTWPMVDWQAQCLRVPARVMKQRVPLTVPLVERAMLMLRRRHTGRPDGMDQVWTFRGTAIAEPNTRAWREALQRAGIDDFRWHDLRHTWASWHVQSGTPLAVLKELGGWKTMQMVTVYAHLATEQLCAASAGMAEWAKQCGTE